jgi:hypothetical protein
VTAEPLRFRSLRIAWSVAWGLSAVLLIVLWVRSDYVFDYISRIDANRFRTTIGSTAGALNVVRHDVKLERGISPRNHDWRHRTVAPAPLPPGFRWRRVPSLGTLQIQLPYWPLFVGTAALAAFPGVVWRFSLRTLLIATTLLAMVLGLAVWAVRN